MRQASATLRSASEESVRPRASSARGSPRHSARLDGAAARPGEGAPLSCGDVYVTFALPFGEPVQASAPAGMTLAEIVTHAEENGLIDRAFRRHVIIYLGDAEIPRDLWPRIRPKPGVLLAVRARPMGGGGGGKNPLAAVLQLIVTVAAFFVGGPGAASFFAWAGKFAGLVQAAAAFAVAAVGNMIVRAIAPMPQPKQIDGDGAKSYDIQFARNVYAPWEPVPVILGKRRFSPPYAAKPYIEIVGDDVFVRMLFCWGLAPVAIADHKIGETAFASYEGVEMQHRLQQGDPWPTLFPSRADEDIPGGLGGGLEMTFAGGWHAIVTTADDADELVIDLAWPGGLIGYDNGEPRRAEVYMRFRYRAVGDTAWRDFFTGELAPEGGEIMAAQAQTKKPLRRQYRRQVARGRYEVAVKRTTPDFEQHTTQSYWTALRTFTAEPPVLDDDLAVTAIRIKATDQLNGALDTYNAIVSRMAPVWNGSAFAGLEETQNPADLTHWVATGPGAVKPLDVVDEIDIAKMGAWRETCVAKDWRCDHIFERGAGWDEALAIVASTGRAALLLRDGKLTPVVDDVQAAPVQLFTPRNCWGFRGRLRFPPDTHALRVRFANEDKGYKEDEIIAYFPGYDAGNAELFEQLVAVGKTRAAEAWRFGQRAIAEVLARREDFTFNADVESLIAGKGARVAVSHYAIVVGRVSARVVGLLTNSVGVAGVVLDERITQAEGATYGMKWREGATGMVRAEALITTPGESRELVFAVTLAEEDAPAPGDLITFGDAGIETLDVIITDIAPRAGLSAEISAQLYAQPEIGADDASALPPWSSNVSSAVDIGAPPPPSIVQTLASEEGVTIVFDFPAARAGEVTAIDVAWRFTPPAGGAADASVIWTSLEPLAWTSRQVTVPPPPPSSEGPGGLIDIRLIAIGAVGRPRSNPAIVAGIGLGAPPDVPRFEAYPGDDLIRFVVTPAASFTPSETEIRYGASWADGAYLTRFAGDTVTVKRPVAAAGADLFWAKARTINGGVYSAAARVATTYQAQLENRNEILATDFDAADWPGAKHDLTQAGSGDGSTLELDVVAGIRRPFGDYYAPVDLAAQFYARNWIETSIGRTTGSGLTWDDVEVAWEDLGPLIWGGVVLEPVDGATLSVAIAVDTPADGFLFGIRFDNAQTTHAGDPPTASSGLPGYAQCRLADGAEMDADSELVYAVAVPETFSAIVDFRPTSVPSDDFVLIRFDGDDGWLEIAYDHALGLIEVTTVDGECVSIPAPAWAIDDPVTIALTQTASARTLQCMTRRSLEAVSASNPCPPIGAFDEVRFGNSPSASETWDDAEWDWDAVEAERAWAAFGAGERDAAGVFGDFEVRAGVLPIGAAAFADFALNRGPAGFSAFRAFVAGDYRYERAMLWFRLAAPQGVGDDLSIGAAALFVDVPDVNDSGLAAIGIGGTIVSFNRHFYAAPRVNAVLKGGSIVASARIGAVTAEGAHITLFDSSDTSVAGDVHWVAHGY